jgi:hypothetical protein
MTQTVNLKCVRASFLDLFVPVEYEKGDGKPRYNATFLIEPGSANDKAIRAAIKAEGAEVFGKGSDAFLKTIESNSNKYCYLDGNSKDYDGYANMMYLATHAKARPLVIDRDKSPLTAADGKPYSGCYVNASVEIWGQGKENKGMRCAVKGVQFVKDGDAFGGGAPASPDDFDDLGVEQEEEDSLAG